MLKSTHKATPKAPLAAGWTEHKAPTGHSYYFNAATKQSTYTRPAAPAAPAVQPPPPTNPSQSFLEYQAVESSDPSAGATYNNFGPPGQHVQGGRGGFQDQRGGFQGRGDFQGHRGGRGGGHDRPPRPQPVDKPKSRHPIPGHAPWILVHTKYGRRFVYNPEKDQSYWRIPDKLKDGILELDQQRIREKAQALAEKDEKESTVAPGAAEHPAAVPKPVTKDGGEIGTGGGDDSSEYEEVEVTDDEDDEENPSKRPRIEGDAPDEPVEFDEDDIAFQLAAMGQEYGLDPGEYDDGNMEDWEEGVEGLELTQEDSAALFRDLLNDFGINPNSPWDRLIEEGKLVDDVRYTALTSMKARKEVWEAWSFEKIKVLREMRAKQERKDPRIPYISFLEKHATPKLYWPEFRRKYKKEDAMRDTNFADKDREKLYREHINRLKLPQSKLKGDLVDLLKSQPISNLNQSTLPSHLPPDVLASVYYISLDASVRDPVIEGYMSTLPPAPDTEAAEEDEEAAQANRERDRRQKALEAREQRVAEDKRRQQRQLNFGRERLREEAAEVARAMEVSKKGLKGNLMDMMEE